MKLFVGVSRGTEQARAGDQPALVRAIPMVLFRLLFILLFIAAPAMLTLFDHVAH